jgi:exopolyphosphatase/guanosine-5'-triphosphate,3'-diphosphate pyrophosphatase
MDTPEEPLRPLDLDPARVVRADRPHYAIIDIGSNSVRLMVYDQLGRAPMPRFNEKSLCRLAEGLAQTGEIAPDGFRRTVEAVRRFRAIADAMGVSRLDVTATEAIRRAANGSALAARISAETGLAVRILSGAEEARYATLGVISGFFRPIGTVGDMGGGSLEVAEAIDDRVGENWMSLPLGALPVEAMLADGHLAAKRRIWPRPGGPRDDEWAYPPCSFVNSQPSPCSQTPSPGSASKRSERTSCEPPRRNAASSLRPISAS